jgi:hypothetical protein
MIEVDETCSPYLRRLAILCAVVRHRLLGASAAALTTASETLPEGPESEALRSANTEVSQEDLLVLGPRIRVIAYSNPESPV